MKRVQPLGNVYDKYHTKNPIARRLVSGFLKQMEELLQRLAPRKVLDLGCGEGVVTERLVKQFPEALVIGADVDFDFLRGVEGRGGARRVVNALPDVCFTAESFDLVVLAEVLEHLESPERSLDAVRRISSGHVFVSVPHEPVWRVCNVLRLQYLRDFGNTPGHINHFSRRSFERLLSRYFSIEALATPFPWLMALCRVDG